MLLRVSGGHCFIQVLEEEVLIFTNICTSRFLSGPGNLSQNFPLHKYSLSSGVILFLSCLDPASSTGQRVTVNGLCPLRYCCSAVAFALRMTCACCPCAPPTWGQPVSDPLFYGYCSVWLNSLNNSARFYSFAVSYCKLYNSKYNS